jgi:hypothetical protein
MATIKKPICTLGIFIVIFTFIPFIVTAQAEQRFECVLCQNMTTTTIVESGDLIIMGYESKGIVLDNSESKFFDNDTVHGVGLMTIEKGKMTGTFYNKHLSPNGDFYVLGGSWVGSMGEIESWKGWDDSLRYEKASLEDVKRVEALLICDSLNLI